MSIKNLDKTDVTKNLFKVNLLVIANHQLMFNIIQVLICIGSRLKTSQELYGTYQYYINQK